ncbi:ABC transporter ATP-binding protein (plasmid) [Bartonella sp. HY329]|uniref:ABC transporter ATP-binding protein n=1 Tax=unclassified Bartonella TaxID=2645622 RepID=UPI0021C7AE50|nr:MULTISPECIES: ABC transporter ATP-binding protein [unclassified Bartonella]UXM96638.1 ABC transporter ATP-binding protein [Bartonella sp. HY329]UXN10961.1 ABC transporter ATP-binding protein [Bartonella sp. HY328]
MTKQPIIEINHLQITLPKGQERVFALADLSLKIHAGEITCLVGESGSGKSLTASAIMGLLPSRTVKVSNGEILYHGEDLLKMPEKSLQALSGNKMAMIFQEPMTALNPQKSVGWQIDEVLRLHTKLNKKDRFQKVIDILTEVHIPDPKSVYYAYPHQISGGQRQRVMIAMALILEPEFIIADEPTTALDVTTQAQILHLIKELQTKHKTGILFITHDFGVVAEIADTVAVLKLGELVEHGSADEVLNRPQHPYVKQLINAVPSLVPPEERQNSMDRPVLLNAIGLNKIYKAKAGFFSKGRKAVHAVKDLSFQLHHGETLGIVGESGSGKSTVSRLITRLLASDSGEVHFDGQDILTASASQLRRLRKDIQMVFQDPMASLNPRKRVIDLIAQGPIIHGVAKQKAHEEARRLVELVELPQSSLERFPHEFSGGQRQRIGIARALALKPKIIVADEPVSALDVSVQEQVLKLLIHLRQELSLSIVFVTHDLRVAAQLCDRVIVMQKGQITEQGETATLYSNPKSDYTKQLLASIPGKNWHPPRF